MTMNEQEKAYHGDVILTQVDALPEGAEAVQRENGRLILKRGESTGHAHAIVDDGAKLFVTERQASRDLVQDFFLLVETPVAVMHEEHKLGLVSPGVYHVTSARERDPYAHVTRAVCD